MENGTIIKGIYVKHDLLHVAQVLTLRKVGEDGGYADFRVVENSSDHYQALKPEAYVPGWNMISRQLLEEIVDYIKNLLKGKSTIIDCCKDLVEYLGDEDRYTKNIRDQSTAYLEYGVTCDLGFAVCGNIEKMAESHAQLSKLLAYCSRLWISENDLDRPTLYPVGGRVEFVEEYGKCTLWLNEKRWEYLEFVNKLLSDLLAQCEK